MGGEIMMGLSIYRVAVIDGSFTPDSMVCTYVRETAVRTRYPASTSRDVSDLPGSRIPSLSNFYCVLRCACGGSGRPGNASLA